MKKVSELSYEELYDLVVTKGGVDFGSVKPGRIDLEGALDEIDPSLIKDLVIDTFHFN